MVRAVVINPLPFPDDRLVTFWKTNLRNASDRSGVAPADFLDLQRQIRTSSAVAAFANTFFDVTGVDEPYRVSAARISANFFTTLGVQPALGRGFTPDDDQPAGAQVAILSHNLWQRRFGGNPDVYGRDVTLNGKPASIASRSDHRFVKRITEVHAHSLL